MNRMAKAAQLEDPNIFDFDGTYELYKRPEEGISQITQKEAPKSRYVQNLKSTAAGDIVSYTSSNKISIHTYIYAFTHTTIALIISFFSNCLCSEGKRT